MNLICNVLSAMINVWDVLEIGITVQNVVKKKLGQRRQNVIVLKDIMRIGSRIFSVRNVECSVMNV